MPTNLYGPGDNFDLATSHVVPALLRKCHEAHLNGQEHMRVWGSGNVRREFLHVDDCARGIIHLLKYYSGSDPINIGSGRDLKISDLAKLVASIIGYRGELLFDSSKPEGTPRKLLNIEKLLGLNWEPEIGLREGIEGLYSWYLTHQP